MPGAESYVPFQCEKDKTRERDRPPHMSTDQAPGFHCPQCQTPHRWDAVARRYRIAWWSFRAHPIDPTTGQNIDKATPFDGNVFGEPPLALTEIVAAIRPLLPVGTWLVVPIDHLANRVTSIAETLTVPA